MAGFHLRLSFWYVVAFLLLLIVLLELHETVHIATGRLICGCWGPRDFNSWSLCPACTESHPLWWLATLAGPLASFALMWLGMGWLNSTNADRKAVGFSLIFANIPFGRISTVLMGGGDEMVVTRQLLKQDFSRPQMILICSALVLLICTPPVVKAFKALTNKGAWLYITGFLTLPLLFLLVYVLTGLNSLLTMGFLAVPWIMGTPVFITLHTALALAGLIFLRNNLLSVATTNGRPVQN